MFKTITDEGAEFWQGKRVLLRLDANVPLDAEGRVANGFRLEQSMPTIEQLRSAGAKVIILAHLGSNEPLSLVPVVEYLKPKLGANLVNSIDELKALEMADGDVAVLDNLRFNSGEEKNDPKFAELLASCGQVYVNDAFSVSHRAHASIVGLPQFLPHYAGLSLAREVQELSTVFNPEHPFLVIISGAKFKTKVPLVQKFLGLADTVVIGGALANSFYKARGWETGQSLVDEELDLVTPFLNEAKIFIPPDVVAVKGDEQSRKLADQVQPEEKILDAGPASIARLAELVSAARLILWNGPLGNFEAGFTEATEALAKMIAGSSARTIIGGGDTIAAVDKLGIMDKFGFVSTAGGAMLDFLGAGTLPGLEALK